MQVEEIEIIADIAAKPYECRTSSEHKILCRKLKYHLPTLSNKKIRLLSFFVEIAKGQCTLTNKDYPSESFVINNFDKSNPEQPTSLQVITRTKSAAIKNNNFALIIPYDKYLSCQALGDTSIEEEIAFMHASEFMCSMPKKKKAKVLNYLEGQSIYFQGQTITKTESGSGVYLVREGEFSSLKKTNNKDIQTLRYCFGQIIGTLQIMGSSPSPHRLMTVKCKTEKSILYHFTEETFNNLVRPYCQHALSKRQLKLTKFIPQQRKQEEINVNFNKTKSLSMSLQISDKLKSTNSNNLEKMQSKQFKSLSTLRENEFFKRSGQIQADGLRKTSYLSLRNDGPLKNFPMIAQRSRYISSQFKDIDKKLQFRDSSDLKIPLKFGKRAQFVLNTSKRDVISQMMRKTFFQDFMRTPSHQ